MSNRIKTIEKDNLKIDTKLDYEFDYQNSLTTKLDKFNSDFNQEIINEIDAAYEDKTWDKYRIVKSHHFALHLDFIKNTFPKSKIIMVLRPDKYAYFTWIKSGGFEKIQYPDYHEFYKDPDNLLKWINIENFKTRSFIIENHLEVNVANDWYWKNKWGIERSEFPDLENYFLVLEKNYITEPQLTMDVQICHYNFNL